MLHWLVKNEPPGTKYQVQQFRYNQWINAGTVVGKNMPDYKYKFYPRSGENIIRVYTSMLSSDTVKYRTQSSRVGGWLWRVDKKITLDREEYFEIYNSGAKIVKKGTGMSIDVRGLEPGIYYFYGEHTIRKFVKR